jgi:hypothetical protein
MRMTFYDLELNFYFSTRDFIPTVHVLIPVPRVQYLSQLVIKLLILTSSF